MVGSSILNKLKDKGFNNILHPTRKELNLYKKTKVMKYLKQNNPEFVLLCAARVGGIAANDQFNHEFLIQNIEIQNNVIYGSHIANIKNLLFLGSSCIYPKFSKQPIKEEYLLTNVLEPTNEGYALAKISGVKLCSFLKKKFNRNYFSVMPCNLYGDNDNYNLQTSHVLPALLLKTHNAKKNHETKISVWGNGEAKREFMHVEDLSDACIKLMKIKHNFDIVNVGSGKEVSVNDLLKLIFKTLDYYPSIEYDKSKPNGTPRKLLSSKKMRQIGWKPKIKLKDGLKNVYQSIIEK